MSNRDEQGRFASSSSANPHSLTPAQPFGRQANHAISNGVKPPAPKSLTDYKGNRPKPAKMPAGGQRPLGMVSDLQLAPPAQRPQQEPQQQQQQQWQPVAEDPTPPVQPPLAPQEPPVAAPRPVALPPVAERPALSGSSGRLALPAGPSAVETMTAGSPIPPSVNGLLSSHGTPPSYGIVTLDDKYTRAAHPNQIGPKIVPGEVIDDAAGL